MTPLAAGLTHITATVAPTGVYQDNRHWYACDNCAANRNSAAGSHTEIRFSAPVLDSAVSEKGWTEELWAAELRVRLTLFQLFDLLARNRYGQKPPSTLCNLWLEYMTKPCDCGECGDGEYPPCADAVTAGLIIPAASLDAWTAAISQELAQPSWDPLS